MTDNAKGSRIAAPLARQHMPQDFSVSLDRYVGRDGIGGGYTSGESRIPADFGPRQPMRGFEKIYPMKSNEPAMVQTFRVSGQAIGSS